MDKYPLKIKSLQANSKMLSGVYYMTCCLKYFCVCDHIIILIMKTDGYICAQTSMRSYDVRQTIVLTMLHDINWKSLSTIVLCL